MNEIDHFEKFITRLAMAVGDLDTLSDAEGYEGGLIYAAKLAAEHAMDMYLTQLHDKVMKFHGWDNRVASRYIADKKWWRTDFAD